VRTGECEAVTPDTASRVAVDSRTTVAEMAGEPAATAAAAVTAAAAAPGDISASAAAEEAAVRAATTPAGEATAIKRVADKSWLKI
jgi:hypothetical protein